MKLDLYQTCKPEYAAPRQPVMLCLKPAQYLGLSGQGEPGGEEFVAGIGALYNVAFTSSAGILAGALARSSKSRRQDAHATSSTTTPRPLHCRGRCRPGPVRAAM